MYRQGVRVLWVFLASLLLTGCWSARELNETAIVAGVGFDRNQAGDKVLTVQIIQPGKLTPMVRGQAQQAVYVEQQTGKTTFETIRNFTHKTSRKLFWAHCQVFILGPDLAKESVAETLNWFYRNQELRPMAYIALSDTRAEDLLKTGSALEPVPAYERYDDIQTLTDSSIAPIVHLKDYMELLARPEGAAYMPVLAPSSKKTVVITGTAVFLHDRLVDKLNESESRGLLSLTGQAKSGPIVVRTTQPYRTQKYLTLEIIRQTIRKSIRYNRGRPVPVYRIDCVADLADDPKTTAHSSENFQQIEQRTEAVLRNDAMSCIRRVQACHADVIGAGSTLERANPRLWKALVPNWDRVFAAMPVEVDVNVHLRHEGLVRAQQ